MLSLERNSLSPRNGLFHSQGFCRFGVDTLRPHDHRCLRNKGELALAQIRTPPGRVLVHALDERLRDRLDYNPSPHPHANLALVHLHLQLASDYKTNIEECSDGFLRVPSSGCIPSASAGTAVKAGAMYNAEVGADSRFPCAQFLVSDTRGMRWMALPFARLWTCSGGCTFERIEGPTQTSFQRVHSLSARILPLLGHQYHAQGPCLFVR